MLKRLFLCALLCSSLAVPGPAAAYQLIVSYRIAGTDLAAVELQEPEVEDPEVLHLKLTEGAGDTLELFLESDAGFGTCADDLQTIIGVADAYAEIVIDQSAQTMNGVAMLQCAIFWGLFRPN
ncbi:hypothetical protein E1180_01990 [Roseibium denhamense]|uniref:Uncharacterized protein n=1 Tax=Roseibium denhamense TaxID=76305 RepID=A0ABY1NEN4_9HYPH|nr:hypothetical protein [Roseibium denhamense]MTI04287.1 hypothetical protein [Roseibium denhamense]SMP07802.1 hypothetical protein SAMN06265374_0890 [Roseibium denhamense]